MITSEVNHDHAPRFVAKAVSESYPGPGGASVKVARRTLPIGCSLPSAVLPPVPRTTTVTTTLPSEAEAAVSTTGWCYGALRRLRVFREEWGGRGGRKRGGVRKGF